MAIRNIDVYVGYAKGNGKNMTDQKLNEAVARRFGWVQCCNPMTMENGKIVDCFAWSKGGSHFHEPYPAYSTSIAAAWEVVEKILELSESEMPSKLMLSFLNIKGWDCTINGIHIIADTAPKAICLAFLKLP